MEELREFREFRIWGLGVRARGSGALGSLGGSSGPAIKSIGLPSVEGSLKRTPVESAERIPATPSRGLGFRV